MRSTSNVSSRLLTVLLFAAALITPRILFAQQPTTLLVDIDHRASTSLDGPWHFLVDEPGTALYAADGKVRDNTYAVNDHPHLTGPTKGPEYDFSTAPLLTVPGDWNTQDPTLFRYTGVLWYQRDFAFTPIPGTRTYLHIGAANYRSHVWLNGQRLCDHEGGFTPFDCDATALLHAGGNFVVIAVDATPLADGIPSPDIDWFNYGGLTRDVSLVSVPTQFIDDYTAHLDTLPTPGHPATVSGYVHVANASAGLPVTIALAEAGLTTTATTDANGRANFTFTATTPITLWSPDHPKLYRLTLATAPVSGNPDRLNDDIGLRTIAVDGTRILLNGQPIFLRGVCIQGEAPIRTGRISTDGDVATLFSYLTDLHANFVRMAHYPYDERMTRTADRLGILVWSEIPLWQRIAFASPGVYDKADTMLHEMIRRDRNKASVVFWSVANETGNFPARTDFLKKLIASAHALDPTRPVTAALDSEHIDGAAYTVTLNDPLTDSLDLIGINEYIGWYVGAPAQLDKFTWTLPNKPLIMSEFGAEATLGNHGPGPRQPAPHLPSSTPQDAANPADAATDPKGIRWTEDSQAELYRHQFVMFAKIPQLRGITPWLLMDFRSPTRNIPHLQDGFNRKGLISEEGQKKQAFYILQNEYTHLTIGKPE